MKNKLRLILVSLFFILSFSAMANPLEETRCCIPAADIKRDVNGDIIRRSDVIRAFKKFHPCPATGLTTGACTGWAVDHVLPLACGGRDEVNNLQWLPNQIKSAAGKYPKDRWERKINCVPMTIITP